MDETITLNGKIFSVEKLRKTDQGYSVEEGAYGYDDIERFLVASGIHRRKSYDLTLPSFLPTRESNITPLEMKKISNGVKMIHPHVKFYNLHEYPRCN